jgi:hypothetical protein
VEHSLGSWTLERSRYGKNKMSKKSLAIASIIWLVVIVITLVIVSIQRNDSRRLESYTADATKIGLARAKEECEKENLSTKVCSNLLSSVSTTECEGITCWIVYARSAEVKGFAASITVSRQNNKYVVTDYLRDTGTQE